MNLSDRKQNIISLSLYKDFKCIADKCTSTCCAGWKITVSDKDYDRFCRLEDKVLRDDIISNIEEKNGKYFFKNMADGRCAMLDDDGLCRIQRNSDEKTLCNTCRKFPRLTSVCGNDIWISFAASCPVTARYLISEKVSFISLKSDMTDRMANNCVPDAVSEILSYYEESCRIMSDISSEDRCVIRYNKYIDVISYVSEIITEDKRCGYLKGCFDYYENQSESVIKDITAADKKLKNVYEKLKSNYIIYRSFSRILEFQKESFHDCYIQVMGEIMLIKMIAVSRLYTFGKVKDESWIEIINWVYRLCAHGRKTSQRIHEVFDACLGNDNIWSILIE